jgi:hypothetical protein
MAVRKRKQPQGEAPPPPPAAPQQAPPQAPPSSAARRHAEEKLCGMAELIDRMLEAYVSDRDRSDFYHRLRSIVNLPLTLYFDSPAAFLKCAAENCVSAVALKVYLILLNEIYTTAVEIALERVRREQDAHRRLELLAELQTLKRHIASLRPLLSTIAEGVAYTTLDQPPPYVTRHRALGCPPREREEREEHYERVWWP